MALIARPSLFRCDFLSSLKGRLWPWLLGCALLVLLESWFSLPAMAAGGVGTNMVLLLDSSGSMKITDPDDLRKPAAKLLVSLLGEQDRASIISFSDQGYPVTYLLDAKTQDSEKKLFSAIEKISSLGVQTNLYSAIAAAESVLARDTDTSRRKLIVLMSDGKMDLGDDEKSRTQSARLFQELIPRLKAADTELQTIAFTNESDKVLLAKIARETGGNFYVAESDVELHNTFGKIFEHTAQPNMLPMEGGHFLIDSAIEEITIIGSKNNPEVVLSITAPDGNTYFPSDKPETYKWLTTPMFDMITIRQPESGEWDLRASSNRNKAFIITNLELQISILPDQPAAGERIQIQAWLDKDGEVLGTPAIVDKILMSAQITLPDGRFAPLPVKAEQTTANDGRRTGVFTGNFIVPDAGRYEIAMSAVTGTLQRKRSVSFTTEGHSAAPVVTEPQPEVQAPQTDIDPVEESQDNTTALWAIYIFFAFNVLVAVIVAATILWRKRKTNIKTKTKDKGKINKKAKKAQK